jgi:hypothetical protein
MPGIRRPAQLLPNSGMLIARFPEVTSSMLFFTVLIGTTRYFVIYHHRHNIETRLTTLVYIITSSPADNNSSITLRIKCVNIRNEIINVLTLILFNILILLTKK